MQLMIRVKLIQLASTLQLRRNNMCVDQMKSFKLNKFGYKWLVKVDGKYYPPNSFPTNKPLKGLGIPQKAKDDSSFHFRKDVGFHIFNNLSEARKSRWSKISTGIPLSFNNKFRGRAVNVLLKVEYSSVKYTGIGDGLSYWDNLTHKVVHNDYEVIVAEEMTLLEEIEL